MIYDKAHELAALLKQSPEYREYIALKDKIESNENDKSLFSEYRKLRFEVQTAYISGENPGEEKLRKLNKLGEVLQFNTDIAGFISAEYRLNQIIGDIYRIIGDAAGIDLNFLKE
ncbi:MAG: YlbF family regulator [Bacillota bacterium]